MSDERLRALERAYRAGSISRVEWVTGLSRVRPLLVELAAYCYDEDALLACGAPPPHSCDPHLWASTLPHVVRCAEKEWPVREVEVRAALALAHVATDAWSTLDCERPTCAPDDPRRADHLNSHHRDEVLPALWWCERAIAGRTTWSRLAREGRNFVWLDGERPLSVARMCVHVVSSRLPGAPLVTLVSAAAAVARWSERHETDEDLIRARRWLLADFPKRLAADLGPWVLGERDPVRERIEFRGGKPRESRVPTEVADA